MKNLVVIATLVAVTLAALFREVAGHLAAVLCCAVLAMKILNTTGEDAAWKDVKDEVERLRGENAQLRNSEASRVKAIDRFKEEQYLLRSKELSAYQHQVLTFREMANSYREDERRLITDASKWRRLYDELRAKNPGEETFDVRLTELTTANQALADENAGMKQDICRLQSQLEAALLPKDPSVATDNSTIADRDQLQEQKNAQLQATCQENVNLRQEVQNLRAENQDLSQRNSAMLAEGISLFNSQETLKGEYQGLTRRLETLSQQGQENQSLRVECADLSSKLATLSQQSALSQQVAATSRNELDALKREVARLQALEVEHEGETTEMKKASEAEMVALRRQAFDWSRTKLEEQEKALRAEFAAQLTQTSRARGPVGAQATVEAELEQQVKNLREEKETLKQQLAAAEFSSKTQAELAKMHHQGQVRAEGDAQDSVKKFWMLDEKLKTVNDQHKHLQTMHDDLSQLYLSTKRERDAMRTEISKLQKLVPQ
ncbi:hypothetical protein N7541_005564 [Penicillium brevicompactum]|uniref:Uncharacterized protein n=1 Tax=Penicillium brevicompactum TaxID=5074 RepID=A0A9W9UT51_PENBR|nr:hypothetical protein N7541_005564 [Penicillium brevicompactum]